MISGQDAAEHLVGVEEEHTPMIESSCFWDFPLGSAFGGRERSF
jgi:hypothetical protein